MAEFFWIDGIIVNNVCFRMLSLLKRIGYKYRNSNLYSLRSIATRRKKSRDTTFCEHTHAQLNETIYRLKYNSQKVATKVQQFASYVSIFRQEFGVSRLKAEGLWKNSGFLQFCPKSKTHPFLCEIYRRFHF